MKLRVLHVIDSLSLGGAERMLVDLCNISGASGDIAPSVLVTRSHVPLAAELDASVPLTAVARRSRFDAPGIVRTVKKIRTSRPAVLHIHGRSSLRLVLSLGWMVEGIPILFHDHFGSIEWDARIPSWMPRARKRVSLVASVSEKLRDWAIRAGFEPSSVHLVPNWIDLQRFRQTQRSHARIAKSGRELRGVVVAGLRSDKGLDVLLQAVSSLDRKYQFEVLIVGGERETGYLRRLRSQIEDLAVGKRIRLLGERQDIPQILANADFAVVPSRSESGPLVLIEHMASGLPVVATRTGTVSIEAERLGVKGIVPPASPVALSAAIRELLDSETSEWVRRSEWNRQVAFRHFDLREKISYWINLWKRAAATS